jgi:Domain of unknown function (DUF222)
VHLARDLNDHLPCTRAALADGDLSVEHAQLIASLHGDISADALVSAEPHLVEWAAKVSPNDLRQVVTHVRHSYAPDKTVRDEADDYDARKLHASATIHGMGIGNFTLHAGGFETVMTAIHAASRPVTGDDRSPAQRRADALITICELALRSGELPVTGGVKPHVTITASLDTITGTSGAPAASFAFGGTASTEAARRYSCDATIARVVFGPDSAILDAGRSTRTFTVAQVRAITARDTTCIWDGCDAPAAWCDAHHIQHWGMGGPSNVDNGALLCGRHHDRVHAHGHQIDKHPNGRYTVNRIPGSDPNWTGHPPPVRLTVRT